MHSPYRRRVTPCIPLIVALLSCGEAPVTQDKLLGGAGPAEGSPAAQCPAGLAQCAGQCFDLSQYLSHCGECDVSCPGGALCLAGACSCPAGQTACGAACTDRLTDPNHCGACGHVCPIGQSCVDGVCGDCVAPRTLCPRADGTMVCVNLQRKSAHCGSCGNACAKGASCVGGRCECPTGERVCGGACVDLQTDEQNCGACGVGCTGGKTCKKGRCVVGCRGLDLSCTDGTNCCGPMHCGTNPGGVRQCCRAAGIKCKRSDQCCGWMSCGSDGTCACQKASKKCVTSADCCGKLQCKKGTCKRPCKGLGSPCTEDAKCCTKHCDTTGVGTGKYCCRTEGKKCSKDTDCCGDLVCNDNDVCAMPGVSTGCSGLGGSCSTDSHCCSGQCSITGRCCVEAGKGCKTTSDCCGSNVCNTATSKCEPQNCVASQGACNAGSQCCSGSCLLGQCCEGAKSICKEHGDCCGTMVCGGYSGWGGTLTCCHQLGSKLCIAGSCCAGECDGTWGCCLPAGTPCKTGQDDQCCSRKAGSPSSETAGCNPTTLKCS